MPLVRRVRAQAPQVPPPGNRRPPSTTSPGRNGSRSSSSNGSSSNRVHRVTAAAAGAMSDLMSVVESAKAGVGRKRLVGNATSARNLGTMPGIARIPGGAEKSKECLTAEMCRLVICRLFRRAQSERAKKCAAPGLYKLLFCQKSD